MKTPTYPGLALLAACVIAAALPADARLLSFAAGSLSGPRLSTGDCDGDGTVDGALAGSLSGRVDEPAALRSARVDWYAAPGTPSVASSELNVADDIAHADLDGDGRDEIVVVGAHDWHVLHLVNGLLRERASGTTTAPLWRVAATDIDGDGRDELALVTLRRGLVDEVPRAAVELVAVVMTPMGVTLSVLDTWSVDAHVGDVCFAPAADGPVLIVETGAEEVGGRLHRLSTTGGLLREEGVVIAGTERLRILSLSAVDVGQRTLVSLGDVTGRIRLVEWRGEGLRSYGVVPLAGTGAALAGSVGGDAQMWIAPFRPGDPLGWWSPVDFR